MMENKPQTYPFQYNKDQASCIRGFANVFDFRHGWFTKNLLADRREARRQAGAISRMKLAVPNPSEKSIYVEDDGQSEARTMNFKTSVKELMEEDMLGEPRLKNQRNDVEFERGTCNSRKGRSITKRNSGRSYERSRSMSLSGLDDLQIKSSSFRKDDLQIKSSSFRKKDVDSDYKQEDQARQALEEKVSASIEKFVSQNLNDARHLSQYGATGDSKDLMDALKTLSSNKELCWKLLGDPNSRLVKRIESLEDEDVEEGGNTNSRLESGLMQKSSVLEKKHETIKTKHGHFFSRRSKSQESYPLPQHEKSHISRKIVILKPAPGSLESHVSAIKERTSSHSSHTKLRSAKNSLHFSFTEIKNRLKKAMGKEKQETSRDLSIHKKHSNTDRGISGENSGWSSPNRNHFYIERFAKPPFGFVGVDKKGKTKDIEKDASDYPKLRSKTSFEAKDHLPEMLDDSEKEGKSISDGLPVYQGRVHSHLDYNVSLSCSPSKCSDEQILPPRKRLISSDSYQTDIGVMHKLEQEDQSVHSSNMEDQSFAAGINAKQDIVLANARLDVPCDIPLDVLLEKAISFTNYEVLESDREESGSTGSLKDEKLVVASCEPSSFPVIKESGHADVTEAFNKETSFQSSDFSSECLRDLPAEQEIISCWSDHPQHSAVELGNQPQKFHFQEPAPSSLDQEQLHTLDFPENEDSAAFEYVEALLLGSGLNWDEYLSTWLSSGQILDPSLCDEIELLSDPSLRKFLFDCTNQVLAEMCRRYFGCFTGMPFVKNNVRQVPKAMDLIQEVWEGVEWYDLCNLLPSLSLEQLVEKDMAMPATTWMDLRSDLEDIGIGLEEAIIDDLVDETLLILANGTLEGVLISPGRERNRDRDAKTPTFPNFIKDSGVGTSLSTQTGTFQGRETTLI